MAAREIAETTEVEIVTKTVVSVDVNGPNVKVNNKVESESNDEGEDIEEESEQDDAEDRARRNVRVPLDGSSSALHPTRKCDKCDEEHLMEECPHFPNARSAPRGHAVQPPLRPARRLGPGQATALAN